MVDDNSESQRHVISNGRSPKGGRRWGVALLMGIVSGAVALVAVYLAAPPVFVAKSVIFIDANPVVLVSEDVRDGEDFAIYKATQMYRALSRFVLDVALREPVRDPQLKQEGYRTVGDLPLFKGQGTPIDWLETKLSAVGNEEEFFEIRMEHHASPNELAEIANAVTIVYIRDVANDDMIIAQRRIGILEGLAVDIEKANRERRDQLSRLKQRLGVSDESEMTLREAAERELTRALHAKWQQQFLELNLLKFDIGPTGQTASGGDATELNPATNNLIQTIVKQELKIAAKQGEADRKRAEIQLLEETLDDKDHSRLIQARDELANSEKHLAELKMQVQPTLDAALHDYQALLRQHQQFSAAARVEQLKASMVKIEEELDRRKASLRQSVYDTRELDHLEAEVKRNEKRRDEIEERIDLCKIELSGPDRIKLHESAAVPLAVDWSQWIQHSAIVGGGAFLAACVLALVAVPRKSVS